MTSIGDASFDDGANSPLRLRAIDFEDLEVVSALVQDSVFSMQDCAWDRKRREFAILINRFRWEDREDAVISGSDYERVRSVLLVRDAMEVKSDIVAPSESDQVFSMLALRFSPGEDGTGKLDVLLAGDMLYSVQVECLDVTLTDVTQPYRAASGKIPSHGK
ncbi:MAG: DUF2948 family protein [Albidovulum sp.]|nr:DUF2948 family protein [Albidovulum sp.]MDE0307823.1 DUF2948 family protein [Albidovulum sp.]MDE0533623.1 DUF2948 family protein [Albidovulum sp.]